MEHRRRAAIVGVVLAGILAGCTSPGFYEPPVGAPTGPGGPGASAAPGASDGPSAAGRTAWENAVAGIERDGTVPLQTALAAFSVAFGALPGVEMPEGQPGFYGSGTGPVRWLLGHWDELTSEQQAAALPYFDPATPPPAAAARPASGPIAAAGPGWPREPDIPAAASLETFQFLANDLAPKISAKLPKGRKLKMPFEVVFRDLPVEEGKVVFAETVVIDETGKFARPSSERATKCVIQINTRGQQLEDSEDQTALVAHELFHCYQFDLVARIGDMFAVPPWIDEAGAAWVGEDFTITELGSTLGQQFWLGWLKEPDGFLFHRGYDAIGWYAHLARAGADPWKFLDTMYLTVVKTRSSFDAYDVAMRLGGDKAIDAWGTSYFRDDTIGGDWTMAGKGLPKQIKSPIPQGPLESGDELVMVVLPTTAWAVKVDIQASVFAMVGPSARGQIRFSDGTTRTLTQALGEAFCTRPEGCTCPEGSAGSAFSFQSAPKGVALVGFTGHTDGLDIDLVGFSAETACEKDPGSLHVPEPCYCAGALPAAIRPDG